MSNLKDWFARDVLIVGKLEAADEIYIPGCGYYQPDPGVHVIICESTEPLHEVQGEEMAFNVAEGLAASENVILRDLAIENTKLRELVKDMYIRGVNDVMDPDDFRMRIKRLGIEVC